MLMRVFENTSLFNPIYPPYSLVLFLKDNLINMTINVFIPIEKASINQYTFSSISIIFFFIFTRLHS